MLVRDNLNSHLTSGMRRFIAARDWPTVYHLPVYAPDFDPVAGIWSALRRGRLAPTAFTAPDPRSSPRLARNSVPQANHRGRLVGTRM
ncbi:hypothetical protein [Streptomyces sp. H39-S7]|uniref:hypothetical protein n=1 Tax=Streptomyces sp. H39-S7 TaxID=3004357 RepID=UPI003FA71AF8